MKRRVRPADRGFTLIELLTVVGIIVILLAVALPSILAYVRVYQIRGGAQQLASLVQAARFKAISKNVNLGVVLVITSPTTFQYTLEDDVSPQVPHPPCVPSWSTWGAECGANFATLLTDPLEATAVTTLPVGISFVNAAAIASGPGNCQPNINAPNEWGLRFNRLGAVCGVSLNPGGCAPLNTPPGAYPNLLYIDANRNANVCLFDQRTSLTSLVVVSPGGRTVIQP
jgi:prepilin-type N-terminal cleavage/methylation domain-containing protein